MGREHSNLVLVGTLLPLFASVVQRAMMIAAATNSEPISYFQTTMLYFFFL